MAASHQLINSPATFLFDALYCEEEHFDNGEIINNSCTKGEGEGDSFLDQHSVNDPKPFLEQDLLWDDAELTTLLHKEQGNELYNNRPWPSLAKARGEAVEWVLKVVGYYSFSALTAVLAVNYLDRFLYRFESHTEKQPWMTQLAAVASLSLAAKVEETHVPLLLDLQVVEETKYVFESKTIQKMEILVLSTLEWKMNPVTPLSFVDYIARRLGLKTHICREFLRECDCFLLSLISDCRFMGYLPSTMATATMLYVIRSLEPFNGLIYPDQLLEILGINKDKVEECYKQIEDHFQSSKKRKFGSLPGSPKGVVDIAFSSDSSNDSWAVAASVASVSSSPEPSSKKIKFSNFL
ncbi:hypothetical protein BUALT_Bualt08G0036000 [Buddleja alternifolia]|uniref:Cyclin D3 n=1 Tax=Buddleja alternifolia TaxID=168488 RepID=A0AAV6XAN9_9LAMI|nr:hypothetical protein BUALT_Bualt08G0036000 [Buddleja alternifolia]